MTPNWRLTVKHWSCFWPFAWPLLVCQSAVLPGGSDDASRGSSLEESSACCCKEFGIQKAATEAYSYHSTNLHMAYCWIISSFVLLLMNNASNLTVDDKFQRLISADLPPSVHPCKPPHAVCAPHNEAVTVSMPGVVAKVCISDTSNLVWSGWEENCCL